MKKLGILFLVSILAMQLIAQSEMMNAVVNLSIASQANDSFIKGVYVEGSPYRSKDSITGTFYQKNNPLVVTKTRLNYYRGNFEFFIDNKTYLLDIGTIDSVIVDGKGYVFKQIDVNGKTLPRIVEVIDRVGNNSIYKFTNVEFRQEVKAGGYIDPKPAGYVWYDPVYLIEIGDKLTMLTNFRKLTSAIPEKENELKKFIKEKKIKKDDPDDLKELLRFINSSI